MPAALAQRTPEAPEYAQPAENILIVVADVQRHLNDDVYRYPFPQDATGQNVFRAAIVRLANYEAMFPGQLQDVVALTKAQAFEKLTAYDEARTNYEVARRSRDRAIVRMADEGVSRTLEFASVVHRELDQSLPRTYDRDLQKKVRDLYDLAEKYRNTPHHAIALIERERAQMQLGEFYCSMRFTAPFSTTDAVAQLKRNIDENKDSKLLYAHHLRLGDLYFDLARQYTVLYDPEGPDFRLSNFEGFANSARSEYYIVQRADGYPEKLEGRAKMAALEALMERVAERAR